jgi:hypothetical protein
LKRLGDLMLALGLVVAGLAAGFVVALITQLSINAIFGVMDETETVRATLEPLIGYVLWGLVALAVVVGGWRRLRSA